MLECPAAYADAVAFVDLSPVRDYRLVPSIVARAVGLQETSSRDLEEQLVAHLRAPGTRAGQQFRARPGRRGLIAKLLAAYPLLPCLPPVALLCAYGVSGATRFRP